MTSIDAGLALLRICLGLTVIAHGYGKFFRGGRIEGTARWFDSIGMRPGRVHALLAAGTEVTAGLLLAIGLVTPVAAAAFVSLMFVAAWTVHRGHGFFVNSDGWEYNMMIAVGAVSIATAGAGRISVDWTIIGTDVASGWTGFAVSAIGGITAATALLAACFRPAVKVNSAPNAADVSSD